MTFHKSFITLATLACLAAISGCSGPKPGTVPDEAMSVKRLGDSFPAADEDYFADMDGGYKRDTDPSVALTKEEVKGRNTWIVWTGGNDRFWDYMANHTFGAFDLLKGLAANPHVGFCIGADKKLNHESEYSTLSEAQCKAHALTWYTPNRS